MSERPHTPLTREEFVAVLSGEKTLAEITRERDTRHWVKQNNKERGKRQAEFEAQFAKMPTRQLLGMRRYSMSDYEYEHNTAFTYALRNVLARRPHVPRGKEQTAIRKAKARKHRGQGKSKNR